MHKILCVDDSPETLVLLDAVLKDYQLTFAHCVAEAIEALRHNQFSLALLDIELPDGSGFDIVANQPELLNETSTIFLTVKSDFASKAGAFSLGADDFIIKPFDPKDLKLRVDARIRRVIQRQQDLTVLRVGPVVCNLDEQRLFKGSGQETIDLTSREVRIFSLFARTPNKIFSREEILDRVWGYSVSVTDRAVDVHVSNLRKKLGGSGVSIEAVVGAGYRLSIESPPNDVMKT
jgi:two-component system alkaline phosphatase synthesis response regulator PhoP